MSANQKARSARIAMRRREALELRIAGVDLHTIGLRFAADPAVNSTGTPYPGGYGARRFAQDLPPKVESFKSMVVMDLERALAERRRDMGDAAAEYLDVEIERLERLHFAIWNKALKGDLRAIDRLVKLMDRRSKLLGLDAASKSEITLTDRDLDAEIDLVLRTAKQHAVEEAAASRLLTQKEC